MIDSAPVLSAGSLVGPHWLMPSKDHQMGGHCGTYCGGCGPLPSCDRLQSMDSVPPHFQPNFIGSQVSQVPRVTTVVVTCLLLVARVGVNEIVLLAIHTTYNSPFKPVPQSHLDEVFPCEFFDALHFHVINFMNLHPGSINRDNGMLELPFATN